MPRRLLVVAVAFISGVIATPRAEAQEAPRNTEPFKRFEIAVEGILNGTLPFDVPIIIWGDIRRPNATHVGLRILRTSPGRDCTGAVPDTKLGSQRYELRNWTPAEYKLRGLTAPDDLATDARKQFEFIVGPFEYGKLYCLEFAIEPGRPLNAEERASLTPRLRNAYLAFFESRPPILATNEQTADELRKAVSTALFGVTMSGKRLVPAPGSAFDPKVPANVALDPFVRSLTAIQDAHNRAAQVLENRRKGIDPADVNRIATRSRDIALGIIDRALKETPPRADAARLRPIFQQLDRAKIAAALGYSTDGADLLAATIAVDSSFTEGDSPSRPCPQGRVRAQCNLLDTLRGDIDAIQTLRAPAKVSDELTELEDRLDLAKAELLRLQGQVNAREVAIDTHLSKFDALLLDSVFAMVTTMGNLSTRRGWHTSSGSGIAVAPVIGEVFPYTGAHFYFRPVNREAQPHSLGTRTSFLFGFTWTGNLKRAGERTALYGSDAMVILGASLRINDVLAFAGGALVFKQENPNPLIQRTKLGMTPFFSLSMDLDVAQVFGGLFGSDAAPRTLGAGNTTNK